MRRWRECWRGNSAWRLLQLAHRIRHAVRQLTFWAVANARGEPQGNAIIITRQASGSTKIDPQTAVIGPSSWITNWSPWSAYSSGTTIVLRPAESRTTVRSAEDTSAL